MRRRKFLKSAVAAPIALHSVNLSAATAYSANQRVRVGLIGCGGRGRYVSRLMANVPNVEFVATCDVYELNAESARAWAGPRCEAYKDFRDVLDRNDVDAVLIATPDHWHAIPAVLACRAGKDVYVEKPLAHNILEGRAILDAAQQEKRVVQTGTQQRSAPHFARMHEIVASGKIGEVRFVRIWNYRNIHPDGIGRKANSQSPKGLDWDFYLGPAPAVPFNRNRFLNTYRWFWDYAGGITTDWGTHRFDSMHQVMGVDAPLTVSAAGGRFELNDNGDVPDMLQITYEYPGFIMSYEACALNAHGIGGRTEGRAYYRMHGQRDRPNGLAFYGTKGTLFADRLGFELYPELKSGISTMRTLANEIRPEMYRTNHEHGESEDSTYAHTQNFIECVRNRRKPIADVEIGHRASTVAHLGNIAYRTGDKIKWHAETESISGPGKATELLGREPRPAWDLI